MTKSELISVISVKTKQDSAKVSIIIEEFFSFTKETLLQNDEIKIREFGVFCNKKLKSRPVRNIRKKTSFMMPEHFVPTFVPSDKFYQ